MAEKTDGQHGVESPSQKPVDQKLKPLTRDEIRDLLLIAGKAAEKMYALHLRGEAPKHPELDKLMAHKDQFSEVENSLKQNFTQDMHRASENETLYAKSVSNNSRHADGSRKDILSIPGRAKARYLSAKEQTASRVTSDKNFNDEKEDDYDR